LRGIPHPRPFQSTLWPHLDLIRKLRLGRKTWPEIGAELEKLGVLVHPDTVGHFFRRAQKTRLPRGFAEGVEAGTVKEICVQPVPSDLPPIDANGKDPLLAEMPADSPWMPKGSLVENSREWPGS